jgi:hypothetical protein
MGGDEFISMILVFCAVASAIFLYFYYKVVISGKKVYVKPVSVVVSHDWGADTLGRDNHARVQRVCDSLRNAGVSIAMDGSETSKDYMVRMQNEVEEADCLIVFLTAPYLRRLHAGKFQDPCKFVFEYGLRCLGAEKVVVVVMEESAADHSRWPSLLSTGVDDECVLDLTSDENGERKGDGDGVSNYDGDSYSGSGNSGGDAFDKRMRDILARVLEVAGRDPGDAYSDDDIAIDVKSLKA